MKVYMFPGQGSQHKGMGAGLFDSFPDITKKADDILNYSIKELCLNDPSNVLNQTQYTQPALFVVNHLHYLDYIQSHPVVPDFLIGHSLGEYNALHIAGVVDFETALKLVKQRGVLMGQAKNGAMAAILKCPLDTIQKILADNNLSNIDIANYNSPEQIVISGSKEDISAAKNHFEQNDMIFIPLKVSAAFHSKYMVSAANDFSDYIKSMKFSAQKIPVISNVTAHPYQNETIRDILTQQICCSVQWTDSIRYLMGRGEIEFKEIGPGNVLTNLLKSIRANATPIYDTKETHTRTFGPQNLGSAHFRKYYNVRYAYVCGSMVKGIASADMVIRMAKAQLMSYYGTGGLQLDVIEKDILHIQKNIPENASYGMNLLCNLENLKSEMKLVDLFIKHNITNIEAAAYIQLNAAIVKYRALGLSKDAGQIKISHRILAKVSRPEVAEIFLQPAPNKILDELVLSGDITKDQAQMAKHIPMADDLCVEADSGGHTDMGNMMVILPSIIRLKNRICEEQHYSVAVRVGAAGGIGTPESAAAAFMLGADFILTGSINQCTVEAGTSDTVKDMLSKLDVQDTEYAPAGDMFEIGAKVQVMKKGVFFPGRANKLYDLWQHHDAWESIDLITRQQIEDKYWGRTFEEVYDETKKYYSLHKPEEINKAEKSTKHKMALVFKWYFVHSMRLAKAGDISERINYQVHIGPAMGAFNRWVENTPLHDWRNRHVDKIADTLMQETANLLNVRLNEMTACIHNPI